MTPHFCLRASGVCLAVFFAIAAGSGPAAAQTGGAGSRRGQGPHVKVELITDRASPGHGMRLGLKFDLDPDWHVYWQNPGDSGGPPEVAWTLPTGMTTAGIEWPAPERIDIGGLVNYGYHKSIVLPVVVGVAAGARIPPAFQVRASLRWMACANLCVPGKADLSLEFPLGVEDAGQVPAWREAIDAARGRVPKPAPADWRVSARSTDGTFTVDVTTGAREAEAVFFPLELSQVNDSSAQPVTPLPNGARLRLKKSSQLVKDPAVLRGILALSGGRTFMIEAPLR